MSNEDKLEAVRIKLIQAHDKAQAVLLNNMDDYGFGLVDGLFIALQLIHEESSLDETS